MNDRRFFAILLLALALAGCRERPDALRVIVHAPPAQGTNAVLVQRFLADWKTMLKERGVVVAVSPDFPTAKQLQRAHALVVCGAGALAVQGEARARLDGFLQRGGGLMALHEAAVSGDSKWLAETIGGAVPPGAAAWVAGPMPLSFVCPPHPLAEGMAGFDLEDRFARNAQVAAGAQVIAQGLDDQASAPPQIWAFEKAPYRAFVALPGPRSPQLERAPYRSLLLRGLAWVAQRDVDLLIRPDERAVFAYPEGGPTAPARASTRIQVPPDFDLSLVAAEPLVRKPVALDWDARGRLWLAEAPDNSSPAESDSPQPALLFLSDTNADGRMDNRTVFYEGPRPITAFAFHRQGVIVAQPPEILFLRDADGDGALDHKETLYTGFNSRDGHAALSHFRWGLDGWLYAAHGGRGADSTRLSGQGGRTFGPLLPGLVRFQPDGSALEQVVALTNGASGFDFSWDGELFFAQAPGAHLSQMLVPERFLGTNRLGNAAGDKPLADHTKVNPLLNRPGLAPAPAGGVAFTASAGAMVYEGGAWPMRYHGSYFVCEPDARVVHEDVFCTLENMGLEATRRDELEFIAATDPWFRPIQIRSGPDGAAYVLDFYQRQRISPSRADGGSAHGRIWRLQHKAARRLEAPALERLPPQEWVKALEHPNAWVRLTAQRLLTESGDLAVVPRLTALLTNRLPYVRVHALWSLQQLGALTETNIIVALTNTPHPLMQRAAYRVVEQFAGPITPNLEQAIVRQFRDADDRAKLLGLLAFRNSAAETNVLQRALRMFPDLKEAGARSAVLALARRAPMEYLRAAFASDKSEAYRELAAPLIETFARGGQSNELTQVILLAAQHPNRTEKLNTTALQTIAPFLDAGTAPAWSGELEAALRKLFTSKSRTARVAVVPLATYGPGQPALLAQARTVRDELLAEVEDPKLNDEERTALITNLFTVKFLQPQLLAVLDDMLRGPVAVPVQRQIVTGLGRLNEPEAGRILVRHYPRLTNELRPLIFNAILKRSEWAAALVQAIEEKRLSAADLDLLGVNRLRHYPDPAVAARAVAAFDASAGALKQDRNAVLERFLPLARNFALPPPRDLVDQGRPLYHRYCVNCHRFSTHNPTREWVIDITASGALGTASVITNILHPNRAVDPRWAAWNITTTKGEHFFGALARETSDTLVLRTFEGDVELKRSDVATTNSAGVSFMPEGFELLGEDALRAVLAYVMNKAPRGFRPLDLTGAFSADSRRALFEADSPLPDIEFLRFGLVLVGSNAIPFHIVNPASVPSGRNLVLLKGGTLQSAPERVEVPVNARAAKLHVLGGVAGWGYPWGDPARHTVPAARLVLHYAAGQTEEVVLKNGEHFADYAQLAEVPGSTLATNLVTRGQLRWFSVEPKTKATLERLVIESFNNHLAPVFVALTVQE